MMDYCTHYIDAIGTVSRACTLTGDMASVITIIIVIAVGCACMWSGEIMTGDLPTQLNSSMKYHALATECTFPVCATVCGRPGGTGRPVRLTYKVVVVLDVRKTIMKLD